MDDDTERRIEQAEAIGLAAIEGMMALLERLGRRGAIDAEDVNAVVDAMRGFVDDDSAEAMTIDLVVGERIGQVHAALTAT